jgi:hypothetical protein
MRKNLLHLFLLLIALAALGGLALLWSNQAEHGPGASTETAPH